MRESIQKDIDKNLAAVQKEQQKQKLLEEAARLKKLAEEMERKRKEKEEQERQRKAAEEEAALRKEMEATARKEQEEEEKRAEKARIAADKKKGPSAEDRRVAQEAAMLEQERRDQELAMRLAMDAANPTNALSEEAQEGAKKHAMSGAKRKVKSKTTTHTFANKKQAALHAKHDLSKWKYADLRDTINTSCDIDLLEAR